MFLTRVVVRNYKSIATCDVRLECCKKFVNLKSHISFLFHFIAERAAWRSEDGLLSIWSCWGQQ
ncbi:MAG: hypothetical protein M3495_06225 [Pseudomonadota bacterium]|nr:hypothetical protein [Gammaproteobacteria bacterium]MDQ3581213.1 hypothetical protein [Pseudomonadota bacterium]